MCLVGRVWIFSFLALHGKTTHGSGYGSRSPPDTISNIVLTKCADILVHRLYHIYLAILKLGIYYNLWK